LVAIHAGHADIGNDQVNLLFFQNRQGLTAVSGRNNIISFTGEGRLNRPAKEDIIIYD
jgi:hypothetical protein